MCRPASESFEQSPCIRLYYSESFSKMGPPSGAAQWVKPAKYCWDIFRAHAVRKAELAGTPYRYWSSFAISYLLQKRLSGRIDFLDAGGRDGGTLRLLKDLSLHGRYTLMDLEPKMVSDADQDFEIEIVQSSFRDFKPCRKFDAILFQSCLEYVESYSDIAWARDCLRPGGFILATIACKNTRNLYGGVWAQGGRCFLDEQDLAPAFSEIGLRVVSICPLGGAVSRAYQSLVHTHLSDFIRRVHRNTIGRLVPRLKNSDPLSPCYRVLNTITTRLDRLMPFWRTGHCVIVERAD